MLTLTKVDENIYTYPTARGARFLVRCSWRYRDLKKGGLRTLTMARAYLGKIKGQQVEQRFFPERRRTPTLKEYAGPWLIEQKARLAANTYRSYASNLEAHILPFLGSRRLHEITRTDILALLRERRRRTGKTANGIRLILAPLSALFTDAVDEGLVEANPCLRAGRATKRSRLEKGRVRKDKVDPFTAEEERLLLDGASPRDYAFILVLVRSGLRSGEALALERRDLNFAQRTIDVNKNYTNGVLEPLTKSGQRRRVDMSQALVRALQAECERQDLEAAMADRQPPALLFPGRTAGRHRDMKAWREKRWYPLLEQLQLRRRPPHHLRHTFVSRLIEHGESLPYIKAQCGHSSIQVTVDIYGHLVPSGNRSAVDRLDG